MSERKQKNSTFTPSMDTPSANRRGSRGIWALVLALVLPPVGIAVLWRGNVFRTRGRTILTAISALEMAILFMLVLPKATISQDVPVASVPALVTVAPDDGTTTALTNLESVLAEQQRAEDEANGVTTELDTDDPEVAAQLAAEQEAILNTVVYAVYDNANYYHANTVCGKQSNRRELTVREALLEGLGACSTCNPPVYTGSQ